MPFNNSHPYPPAPTPVRRGVYVAMALVAVVALVYSGTVWLWLRPMLHKPLINKYAGEYKMDPLWAMSVIRVESSFAVSAHSPRGAMGLMQLLPSTAREIAPEIGLKDFQDADLKNPDINLHLGFYYLTKLKRAFPDDEIAVLSAYNAGPGITLQWRKGKPALEITDIEYPETRRFVRRVQVTYTFLKSLQRWKHLFGINS